MNRVRLCTVSGSGSMALMAFDLGSLNTINGSFSCGAFVAFCSCVVGLYQLGPKSERPGWRFAMHVLAVLGNAVASLCLFYAVASGKCVVASSLGMEIGSWMARRFWYDWFGAAVRSGMLWFAFSSSTWT